MGQAMDGRPFPIRLGGTIALDVHGDDVDVQIVLPRQPLNEVDADGFDATVRFVWVDGELSDDGEFHGLMLGW
jgi:hypothetical protein